MLDSLGWLDGEAFLHSTTLLLAPVGPLPTPATPPLAPPLPPTAGLLLGCAARHVEHGAGGGAASCRRHHSRRAAIPGKAWGGWACWLASKPRSAIHKTSGSPLLACQAALMRIPAPAPLTLPLQSRPYPSPGAVLRANQKALGQ